MHTLVWDVCSFHLAAQYLPVQPGVVKGYHVKGAVLWVQTALVCESFLWFIL